MEQPNPLGGSPRDGSARDSGGRDGGARDGVPPPPRRGWGLVRVRGESMTPTLAEADLLLVRWGGRAPRPGDLVVVRLPGRRPLAVKRLWRREPDGGWWVERDNPAAGVDSWLVGAVPPGELFGTAQARLWPRPRWPLRRRTQR